MADRNEKDSRQQYEHAGTWICDICGEEFEVETELDPLSHALSHATGWGNDE